MTSLLSLLAPGLIFKSVQMTVFLYKSADRIYWSNLSFMFRIFASTKVLSLESPWSRRCETCILSDWDSLVQLYAASSLVYLWEPWPFGGGNRHFDAALISRPSSSICFLVTISNQFTAKSSSPPPPPVTLPSASCRNAVCCFEKRRQRWTSNLAGSYLLVSFAHLWYSKHCQSSSTTWSSYYRRSGPSF